MNREAWKYFERVTNSETAKCKEYLAIIKCEGCSTSELLRHLRSVHSELLSTRNALEEPLLMKRNIQTKMTSFIKIETMQEIMSKLASVNGFSIDSIV